MRLPKTTQKRKHRFVLFKRHRERLPLDGNFCRLLLSNSLFSCSFNLIVQLYIFNNTCICNKLKFDQYFILIVGNPAVSENSKTFEGVHYSQGCEERLGVHEGSKQAGWYELRAFSSVVEQSTADRQVTGSIPVWPFPFISAHAIYKKIIL